MKRALTQLGHFIGSETFYRHAINPNVRYTEGARYVAVEAGAYWLIDQIALAQVFYCVEMEEFQVWMLQVNPDRSALLTCEDGNDRLIYRAQIPYTDFPEERIRFYVCDGTLMLPGEY